MHMGNSCFGIGLVDIEDVGRTTVRVDYKKIDQSSGPLLEMLKDNRILTLPIHGHVQISDRAILAKDFVQVILIDGLGQFFNDDLKARHSQN